MRLRKRPGSDRVGYGLKVPRTPRRRKAAYRGSCLVQCGIECGCITTKGVDSLKLYA
jgi:hypothetical protein